MTTPAKSEKPDPLTPSAARVYDNAVRWLVRSRANPKREYFVDLAEHGGNGSCTCKDFQTRFGPLLKASISPEQALREGMVQRRPWQPRVKDSLRCFHLIDAHLELSEVTARAFANAEKKNALEKDEPY